MEILGNSVVGAAVETLVDRAQKGLFIVTPYFKPWDRVARGIKVARSRNAEVIVLLRGGDDRAKSAAAAADFLPHGVKFGYLSRLHAKVYLNETEAILTSMNLYAESAQNSYEVAVRYTKAEDPDAYKQVAEQVVDLLRRAAEEEKVAAVERAAAGGNAKVSAAATQVPPVRSSAVAAKAAPVAAVAAGRGAAAVTKKAARVGHCIRCAEPIAFDTDHPYCESCYKSWVKYKNPDYEEKHCHGCGKAKVTTMTKPQCKPCWEATA